MIKIKSFKVYFVIFVASVVMSIATAVLRGGSLTLFGLDGVYLSSLVGSIFFGLMTLIAMRRLRRNSNPLLIMFAVLLGVSILDVPFRLFNFQSCIHTLGSLLAWWFGIVSAYFIYISKKTAYKFIISVLSLVVIIWFSYFGYQMWLQ